MNLKELRPFQRRFIKGAFAPGIRTACLSLPRANGKSWLAAKIIEATLTPGDSLFADGKEVVLCARNLEQSRIVFKMVREFLGEDKKKFRYTDSTQRVGVVHLPSNSRLRVISSDGAGAMGLQGVVLAVGDEPGAWLPNSIMQTALNSALGKPNSSLRLLYIGTLAPATGGWWHELVTGGSKGSRFVMALIGDRNKWESWKEIKRVNPLTSISPEFRAVLKEQRADARADGRLKAEYLSYHLNIPTADASTMLLTTDDWDLAAARPVPQPEGAPIVAVDLGAGRAWSAATAVWENGRVECLAVAPGVPSLRDQERRDHVSPGSYEKLASLGLLEIAEGLRVQPPAALWESIVNRWGFPAHLVCDRFRLADLEDAVQGQTPIEDRVVRWSEASADIRALQRGFQDGPYSVAEESRPLLAASLAVAMVKTDDAGNVRLSKRGSHNQARDDVAAALTLAAGAHHRAVTQPEVEELEFSIV